MCMFPTPSKSTRILQVMLSQCEDWLSYLTLIPCHSVKMERERERRRERGRRRQRERESMNPEGAEQGGRISSRLPADNGARQGTQYQDPAIMTWAETKCQTRN